MFIMVDGLDGSGKSTVIDAWKEFLKSRGNGLLDVRDYQKNTGALPGNHELKAYDFLISAEPTYVGIGKIIRDDLIKSGTHYPPLAIAESYSLDRLILYTKTLLPALKTGACVIQDRGVSSSLAYQPLMTKNLTKAVLAKLPGNALALKNAPNHLVIITCNPAIALKRLASRSHKQDNVIFERAPFLKKLSKEFSSPTYKNFFTRRGTTVHYLQGDVEIGIMKEQAIKLLKELLNL